MKKTTLRMALILLCVLSLCQTVSAAQLLIPGGQVIGLELLDGTLTVNAFDETIGRQAQAQGLAVGDRITGIDGNAVHNPEDIRQALNRSNGIVELSILRGEKEKRLRLTPQITREGPRLGIYLRQGVSGLGTVTWIDPETGSFGALGHSVNTPEGAPVALRQGQVYPARILSVNKGTVGKPGQLLGLPEDSAPLGTLRKNTPQGIFGTLNTPLREEPLPIARRDEIRTGSAVIRSTIRSGDTQEYSVEILKIYPGSSPTGRNLLLRVTDPALLSATNGIVQGMSGSPIIQDGKLVGAVTHVLVNDPTTGYGIFIENMLDAAA